MNFLAKLVKKTKIEPYNGYFAEMIYKNEKERKKAKNIRETVEVEGTCEVVRESRNERRTNVARLKIARLTSRRGGGGRE